MADTTEPKLDPTTTSTEETNPAPAVEKTEGEEEKSVTEKATDAAIGAATKATDNVFSMFGGGPKKEKKEEADDDADEPSGSSKAKAAEEVSL